MTRSRALFVVLLLGVAAPIGLGGLALPAYAQEDGGDSQSDDAGDPTATNDPTEATQGPAEPAGDAKAPCVEGKPCPQPKPDFNKLDVGEGNSQQNIAVIRKPPRR